MPKPDLHAIPAFYHKYVILVPEDDSVSALANTTEPMLTFLENIPAEQWDFRYAEGKWSIREVVQHMIDTERIFSYRALCFARSEKASLPGFDENKYAAASEANRRDKEELIDELAAVRNAMVLLFRSFSAQQLLNTGVANNKPMGVNDIGFIATGHVLHHLNILKERYLS